MIEQVLSDADIAAIISESDAVEGAHMLPYSFARTVEKAVLAKLAEKQEPVAFICHGYPYLCPSTDDYCGNVEDHILLYARPAPPDALRKAVLAVIERWGPSSWPCQEQMAVGVNELRDALHVSLTGEGKKPVDDASVHISPSNIRQVGGIVHGDGNIFFTNAEQLNKLITRAIRKMKESGHD